MQNRAEHAFCKLYSVEKHNLINAMLFGSLEGLSEETIFLFSRTGLIHLFSASGFHLAVALGLTRILEHFLYKWIARPQIACAFSFLASISLMVYFGHATNWSSPMVRAFVFTSIQTAARAMEIKENKNWVFLLSLLFSSVLGKGSQLSFLLSALGMAGIIYVKPRNFFTLLHAPWLCTLPLVVWHFNLVSLSAPIWNLVFGSLISLSVMPLAIVALLGRSMGLPTGIIFDFCEWLMNIFVSWLEMGDQILGGAFWVAPIPWLIGIFFSCISFYLFFLKKNKYGAISLLLFLILAAWPKSPLVMLDVGQGDAIYLRTKNKTLLVDLGPGNEKKSAPIAFAFAKAGLTRVDDILLTHPDKDHRGGLRSFLGKYPVSGDLWVREESLGEKGFIDVIIAAELIDLPFSFLEAGSTPKGLQCWFAPYQGRNSLSPLCQAKLKSGETILLTGDLGFEEERYLLKIIRDFPQSDYLKVGHHGSRTSSSPEFLSKSGAKTAFISVGRKNRYGHPTFETLDRLEKAGMKIKRTDLGKNLSLWPYF